MYIEFEKEDTGRKARREHTHALASDIDPRWVPIKQIVREISISKNAFFTSFRKQFPLTPEALTIHKAQGSTLQAVCVTLKKKKTLPRDLLYVALSRVTRLHNLYIVGEFKAPLPPGVKNDTMNELHRLKTQKPLKFCFNTLQEKLGMVIGYHNTTSFVKYKQHISNDSWYRKCDILILTESQTKDASNVDIPEFEIIDRYDVSRTKTTRGILIYAKKDTKIANIHENVIHSKTSAGKPYHSELHAYNVNETCLITGYKSPLTPNNEFLTQVRDTWKEVKSYKKHILMGDFNCDIFMGNLSDLLAKEFHMKNKLAPEELTTNYNTQIDIVFADFECLAGAYESYFSYHKPIFCMLIDEKVTTEQLQKALSSISNKKVQKEIPTVQSTATKPTLVTAPKQTVHTTSVKTTVDTKSSVILTTTSAISSVRTRAQTILRNRIEYCNTIITPFAYLQDTEIDEFTKLVNNTTGRNMISTICAQRLDEYDQTPEQAIEDDVQILFEGNFGPQNIGHYICIHFVYSQQKVYIYDSLHHGNISERSKNILRRRYPIYIEIVYCRPKTKQPDLCACGVFATAYATTIILGQDPATYNLALTRNNNPNCTDSTIDMRHHLANMIRRQTLALFPTV